MKILLATGNIGKLIEMESVFRSANLHDVEILTLKDLPAVEEPIEDGNTFLANAYIKAIYYYEVCLDLIEKARGNENFYYMMHLLTLASACEKAGLLDLAVEYCEKAVL